MRVIICGGRDHPPFTRHALDWLDDLHKAHDFREVVTGGAQGADTWGQQWASQAGIDTVIMPANWKRYGKFAGPHRNHRMAAYIIQASAERVMCLAFPGGTGTASMCAIAAEYGIEV